MTIRIYSSLCIYIVIQGHLRLGKAFHGLKDYREAMKAMGNAYRDVREENGDRIRINILIEAAQIYKDAFCKLEEFFYCTLSTVLLNLLTIQHCC